MSDVRRRHSRGAVLLLALLVMSSVLVTGATLATISILSLRQGRLIDDAIIAYGAAESSAEQSLYQLRRLGTTTTALGVTYPNDTSSAVVSGPAMTNGSGWKRTVQNGEPVVYAAIAKDKSYELTLWDPEAPSVPAGIASLKYVWNDDCNGDSGLEVLSVGWDPTVSGPPLNPDISFHGTSPSLTYLYNAAGVIDNNYVTSRAYRVRLRAKTCNIFNLAVTAYSLANAGGVQVNLPSRTAITATGTYNSARQALEIRLPRLQPLSGVFDFVIFAQCSILKGVGGGPPCP